MTKHVEIIYDGQCPVCRNINQYRRLKESGATITLTDARDLSAGEIRGYLDEGTDLNNDMIVIVDGRKHVGGSALRVLSELSDGTSMLGRIVDAMFRSSSRPGLYRIFVWLRRLLLRLLGRTEIRPM